MSEDRRFCENCGTAIGKTTNFCPNCGAAQRPDPDVSHGPLSPAFEAGTIRTPKVPGVPPIEHPPEKPNRRGLRIFVIGLVIAVVLLVLARACGGGATSGKASSESFTKANYAELATDPNSFRGASVNIEGRVFRNPEVKGDETSFQMFADPENSEWNTVVHTDSAPSGLASGDTVGVRGKVQGAFKGENAFGATIKATEVRADSVEITETEAQRKAKRRP